MTEPIVLHYYPGHFPPIDTDPKTGGNFGPGLLIALRGTTELFRGKAWGGPSLPTPDPRGIMQTPTPAGTYLLMKPAPYSTRTWKFSEIKWGTKLKDTLDGSDVLYLVRTDPMKGEVWGSIKKDFRIDRNEIRDEHRELYGSYMVPSTWVFNAFGPLAVRFFKDKNNNGKFDKETEAPSGAMFHTTAENEAQLATSKPIVPSNSHGCIHMHPKHRDTLRDIGALKAGIKLVIHAYSEHYGTPTKDP